MARVISGNRFKVGLFAPNVWGGLTQTLAPERWDASWENNVRLAQEAEAAGFDFILPLANWLGLDGDAETDTWSLETLTWAAGILQATDAIKVFATVNTAFLNPVVAAKQIATVDHIGNGRLCVNVVSGSRPDEFALMGLQIGEHDDRYRLTEQWVTAVRRMWTESEPFDQDVGPYTLRGALSEPKPVGAEPPLIVSAGSSPAGRAFAARNADCLFMIVVQIEGLADEIQAWRDSAARSDAAVMCSGHVFCRATKAETDEYYHHIVHEHGDWKAGDHLVQAVWPNSESLPHDMLDQLRERSVSGHTTFPVVGTPDEVAETFRRLSEAGLDGISFSLPNFLDDLPILREEVLPRMERMGLRAPDHAKAV
jgi:alkanesulfonate monooxygenase SsuD/methylene tetrahydromethanopterin reductase-like flavin-dependent oxidoreductase (luciferase family)